MQIRYGGTVSVPPETCRKVPTQSARGVGDLARIFGNTKDVKTTPTPGRRPATSKTTQKTARTEEDDGGTQQCVPKLVIKVLKTIVKNLTKLVFCLVMLEYNRQLILICL